jgi:hypothetical protein
MPYTCKVHRVLHRDQPAKFAMLCFAHMIHSMKALASKNVLLNKSSRH